MDWNSLIAAVVGEQVVQRESVAFSLQQTDAQPVSKQ